MKYNTMTDAAVIYTDGTKEINGQKIILKEYPELEFYSYAEDWLFFVCEYESGRSLGSAPTLRMAKERALKNIAKVGIVKIKTMIQDSIKQYGYANKKGKL